MTKKTNKELEANVKDLTEKLNALTAHYEPLEPLELVSGPGEAELQGRIDALEAAGLGEPPSPPPPEPEEEVKEAELPVQEFQLRVNKGKFFPNDYVVKVQLPTVSIHHRFHEAQLVGESSIIVTMIHGPGVAKGLVAASREDQLDFHIDFLFDGEVYSTWKLENAKLKEMSFGLQSKLVPERPGEQFIECGIIFDSACIDGETF